ncbi:MAG: TRAP transporter substrate-binding protein DctP [Desulfobacteraceae bacterium]|nr:MAG: TRAP transporter substrate-binding protein DctP [Desulfobacteraceae bacterium]
MKRYVALSLLVFMVLALSSMPIPAQAADKPIQLKLASHWPVLHDMNNVMVEFARAIGRESEGRINATYYPAGMLAGSFEKYEKVRAGVCDITNIHIVAHPGSLPLVQLSTLPFLFNDGTEATWVLNQMSDVWAPRLKEKNLKLLFMIGDPNFQILLRDKKVTKVEDLKGLRLRCGGIADEALKIYGAVPVKLKHTDMYLAMQRGVVDGIVFPVGAGRSFKLEEVTKYILKMDFFSYHLIEAMNLKTWNRLPKDLQDAVMRASYQAMNLSGFHYQNTDAFTFPYFKSKGVEIVEPDDAELGRFKAKVAGLKDKMIEDLEKKGIPGKKTMDRMEDLMQRYRAWSGKAQPKY